MAAGGRACVAVGDHGVGVAGPRAGGLPCLHGLDLPPQHQVVKAVQVLGGNGASHLGEERELEAGTRGGGALSREPHQQVGWLMLPRMTCMQPGPRSLPSSTLSGSPLPSGDSPNTSAWCWASLLGLLLPGTLACVTAATCTHRAPLPALLPALHCLWEVFPNAPTPSGLLTSASLQPWDLRLPRSRFSKPAARQAPGW